MREIRTVSAAPENSFQATAASTPASRQAGVTAGGTAGAVAAVPQPERGSDELEHHLDLEDKPRESKGDDPTVQKSGSTCACHRANYCGSATGEGT